MADGAKDTSTATNDGPVHNRAGAFAWSRVGKARAAQFAPPDPDLLLQFDTALRGSDPDACFDAIADLGRAGIGDVELHDSYVPAVARRMGEDWCSDQMSFAEVTIGTARLQAVVRDISRGWIADGSMDIDAPTVLLALPRDCFHTLGGMVLAGQMRRRGISVKVLLDARPETLTERLNQSRYDMVMLSCTSTGDLESVRNLIEVVSTSGPVRPKVAVGGGILAKHPGILDRMGADVVTCDLDEALDRCGLKNPAFSGNLSASGA